MNKYYIVFSTFFISGMLMLAVCLLILAGPFGTIVATNFFEGLWLGFHVLWHTPLAVLSLLLSFILLCQSYRAYRKIAG